MPKISSKIIWLGSKFVVPLPSKTSRAVQSAPTELRQPRWSRYDVEDYLSLQKQSLMNNLQSEFAARFAPTSITSLVDSFNAQVGSRAFNSARAAHDIALIDELIRRGIDVSSVYDGTSISFAHHVSLQEDRLVIVE